MSDAKQWIEDQKKLNTRRINENDPYGFMEEFDLNAYDREYSDKARKDVEANPFGKSKYVD